MRLVERMTLTPATCIGCGCGNTPDQDGEIGPFLDIERDVDWADSVYFCPRCVMAIAATTGYASPDEVGELSRQLREKDKKIHDLQSEIEQRTRQARTAEKKLKVVTTAEKITSSERRKAGVA